MARIASASLRAHAPTRCGAAPAGPRGRLVPTCSWGHRATRPFSLQPPSWRIVTLAGNYLTYQHLLFGPGRLDGTLYLHSFAFLPAAAGKCAGWRRWSYRIRRIPPRLDGRVTAECYAPNSASRILDGTGVFANSSTKLLRRSVSLWTYAAFLEEQKSPTVYGRSRGWTGEPADFSQGPRLGGGAAITHDLSAGLRQNSTRRILWGISRLLEAVWAVPGGNVAAGDCGGLQTAEVFWRAWVKLPFFPRTGGAGAFAGRTGLAQGGWVRNDPSMA